MYHGEEVVRPQRQAARALIAMRDKIKRADGSADLADLLVGNIPNRHAVGCQSQGIMIGNGPDPANCAAIEQPPQARDDIVRCDTDCTCNWIIWLGNERQPLLGRLNQTTIDGVEHAHTSMRNSTKNSRSFGMGCTSSPVSRSISAITSGMRSCFSALRTNHMLSACIRS